jgi:hypothetical protein
MAIHVLFCTEKKKIPRLIQIIIWVYQTNEQNASKAITEAFIQRIEYKFSGNSTTFMASILT